MAQVSHGVRKILEIPWIYSLFQKSLERRPIWAHILEHQIGLGENSLTVLDIGCGPGTLLTLLGNRLDSSRFVGIDISSKYVKRAEELFPSARFLCGTVETINLSKKDFDLIVISGVLHHVDDEEAIRILRFADAHKSDQGTIVTLDPVFFPGQNFFAKWVAQADRGQNVRTVRALEQLWRQALPASHVQISLLSGYSRLPQNWVSCKIAVEQNHHTIGK